MDADLTPSYSESRALLIGIDKYAAASPLFHAVSDAKGVAKLLSSRFGFDEENVLVLLDEQATRDQILHAYLGYTEQATAPNDRLVVFFAGHGHTVPSRRGEVGFLVPYDGDPSHLSTLIRWDYLTRSADLIAAKHVLFLMDACYGGLAITRSPQPGSTRFLKDMLLRVSRQVLTAGKANEAVADVGGPLAGHSVFTGHLIKALEGEAADSQGILTANGVMAHVYRGVGQDPDSHQTPHYGYLDGDGDLIFAAPILSELDNREERDSDVFYAVPAQLPDPGAPPTMSLADQTRHLLSDPRNKISLHTLVASHTRDALASTDDAHFPLNAPWSAGEFQARLSRYEASFNHLVTIYALLGSWATRDHSDIITLAPRRLCGRIQVAGGLNVWLSLRWYPPFLLAYAAGIAAVASSAYHNLTSLFHARVPDTRRGEDTPLLVSLVAGVGDLSDGFKALPGHERQYVPHSEYIFKQLQPKLDDLLFLGTDYEPAYDRFEMLLALEHAHLNNRLGFNFWGPLGRFGWKHHRGLASPYSSLISEALSAGPAWPPTEAGLFGGSEDRFKEVSAAFGERLNRLGWL